MSNHYDTLGVTRTAPPEVIKAAYRALSQKWHPDKNKSAEAPMRMRELNTAWSVLSDARARTAYDNELDAAEAHPHAFTCPQQSRHKKTTTQEAEREWVSKPFVVDEGLLNRALHPPRSYDWVFSLLFALGMVGVFILLASIIG